MDVRTQVLKEYCKRDLQNFIKLCWNSVESVPLEWNNHMDVICNALQKRFMEWKNFKAGEENKYNDIIINVPPGSSKSLITSVFFPVWIWLHNSNAKIACVSYSQSISENLSRKRINLLQSDLLTKMFGKYGSISLSSVYSINRKGLITTTSVEGSITGLHFDILLVDDANNPKSIYSEASRKTSAEFVLKTLPSRKTNIARSFSVYVQQRLHNDDVTGNLLALKKKYTHVIIPAIDENGQSFFPARFPLDYLADMREQLGTRDFEAQYMQKTQSDEGTIIRKEWLQFIEMQPKQLVWILDTAYGGNKDNNDFNSLLGVEKIGNQLYIHKSYLNKYKFPELLSLIKEVVQPHGRIFIEGKASGKSVIQTLQKETNFNIKEIMPNGSKNERKHACSPSFESKKIFINKDIDNKDEIIKQLIFDDLKHDDILDTIMYAVEHVLRSSTSSFAII